MTYFVVYATFADTKQAQDISKIIVGERLAACANIFPPISSIYWWNDDIQSEEEVAVIFKTKEELYERLQARIKELHSYECPCIVAWKVEKGSDEFLNWLGEQTAG